MRHHLGGVGEYSGGTNTVYLLCIRAWCRGSFAMRSVRQKPNHLNGKSRLHVSVACLHHVLPSSPIGYISVQLGTEAVHLQNSREWKASAESQLTFCRKQFINSTFQLNGIMTVFCCGGHKSVYIATLQGLECM